MPKKPSKPQKGKPLDSSEGGVIYARYSSHAQKDASIEQQVREAQAYAAELGIPIREVYADRAITGKTDRRPNFQKMMKDAEKGKFHYVIAWKSNRMGRNMLQAMINEARLQELGIRVLYTEEDFDDTAAGRFALRSMMNVNQFYSENMAEDIRRGLRDNAQNCKLTNGSLPFGYKKGEDLRYELDPPKDDIVREIFGRVACGEAFVDIANDLNARGIRTVRGNHWGKGSFHAMLVNERYRGIYIYDDIRIEGGIPRIISDELFFKVQEVLKTKKNPQGRHRMNGDYLLTGKLFCGKCKSPMVGISGTSKTGDLHYYYTCQKKRVEKACSKANIRRDAIEEAVARAIKEYALQDDVIAWIADSTVAYNRRQEEQSHISILEDELTETKRAIKNIMAAIEQGIITDSTKGRLLELEAEQARLTGQIAAGRADIITISRDDVIAGLEMFRDGDVSDKKYQAKLFDTFLVAVYVYDDDMKIVFSFSGRKNTVSVPLDASLVDGIENNAEGKVRIGTLLSHQMDIGRTPIISKAALLYWCGSDVKTKDGCQRLNAIDSRPFLLSYYKYYFGSSSFFCALSKNPGNTFMRRWPKGIIIILYNNGYSCKNWSDKICINSFYEDKLSPINYCKFKTNHFYSEIRIHFILLGKRITCNIIYKKSKCFITSNAIKIAKANFFARGS